MSFFNFLQAKIFTSLLEVKANKYPASSSLGLHSLLLKYSALHATSALACLTFSFDKSIKVDENPFFSKYFAIAIEPSLAPSIIKPSFPLQ